MNFIPSAIVQYILLKFKICECFSDAVNHFEDFHKTRFS